MDIPALPLLIVAGAVAAIVVLWWAFRPRRLPYSKRSSLLTAGELRFYQVLLQAVPPGMALFVKVRLMDVVWVPDDAWRTYGAPASGMHFDFVLADAASTEPQLVIELDDKSHWRPETRKRDAFKNAALAAASVPILRVTAARRYDAADLRARIQAALSADSSR
jgi:hypothetical protein